MKSASELVAMGYGGYQGWSDPEAGYDFQATGGSGKYTAAGGGGGGGANIPAPYAGEIDLSQVPGMEQYIQGQFATEDPILQALMARMGAQERPLDIFQRLESEAGLPEMRGVATSLTGEVERLEDILYGIEPQVAATTRESMVTEAQRKGIIQAKAKPFLETLGRVGTALGRIANRISVAEQGTARKVELAMLGQEKELKPLELYLSVLMDRNSRLASGFSTDRQTKLDMLYDKLQRTRELSDMEWKMAQELALSENEYKKNIQKLAAQYGYQVTGNESIEQLLGEIGRLAMEETGWERGQAEGGELASDELGWAEGIW